MQEDPIDHFARLVVASSIFVVQVMESEARRILSWLTYHAALISIEVRYRGRRLWSRVYWRGHLLLQVVGIVRELTWEDVEAERLRIEQQTGQPLARSPELEEGLRRERLGTTGPNQWNDGDGETRAERKPHAALEATWTPTQRGETTLMRRKDGADGP